MIDAAINADPKFGFRNCIGSALLTVRDHWLPLVSAAFLREFVSLLVGCIVFALFVDWRGWNLVVAFVVRCLMWSALQAGYLKFCMSLCEDKVQWNELFSGFRSCFQMLIATICIWFTVGFGLVFFVVPGLFVAVRFSLSGFALVDQNLGALRSLATSHRMIKGFAWCATGVLLIYCLGAWLLGLVAGMLEPLMVISLCTLYKHIKMREEGR